MSAPFPPDPPEIDILTRSLWHLEFADDNFCVAEMKEQQYLVLFTAPERVREFVERGVVAGPLPASAVLFSDSGGQFTRAAVRARERGLHGAIIDPEPSGRISTVVDFTPPEELGDGD